MQPDNFLVSGSGHLKIADFGLATSGEWIYQESYRSSHRKDLLRKYHQAIVDDGSECVLEPDQSAVNEPKLNLRSKLNKMDADSIVGPTTTWRQKSFKGK